MQDLANSVGHRLPPLFPTQLLNWAGKLSLVVQLRRCGPAAIEVTHESADNSTSTMQRDWQQFVQNNGRLRQASALSGSNRVLASAEASEYLQREESAL